MHRYLEYPAEEAIRFLIYEAFELGKTELKQLEDHAMGNDYMDMFYRYEETRRTSDEDTARTDCATTFGFTMLSFSCGDDPFTERPDDL